MCEKSQCYGSFTNGKIAEFLKDNDAIAHYEEKPLINLDRVRMTKKTKYVSTGAESAPWAVLVERVLRTLKHESRSKRV